MYLPRCDLEPKIVTHLSLECPNPEESGSFSLDFDFDKDTPEPFSLWIQRWFAEASDDNVIIISHVIFWHI